VSSFSKSSLNSQQHHRIDKIDYKIMSLLLSGFENKNIARKLRIPLSTIQRRRRYILQGGFIHLSVEPNYKSLGLKKGLVHVYMSNGNVRTIAEKVTKLNGILSAGIHVGNSDIVGEFIYKDSEQLVDLLSEIKRMEGVDRTVWSEEAYLFPTNKQVIHDTFQVLVNRQ
jgi:DNA-binding Lrp family transcriptional regulator